MTIITCHVLVMPRGWFRPEIRLLRHAATVTECGRIPTLHRRGARSTEHGAEHDAEHDAWERCGIGHGSCTGGVRKIARTGREDREVCGACAIVKLVLKSDECE